MTKGKMGRATKLTPGIQEAICIGVREGLSLSAAAELCGVSARAALEWAARGEDRDPDRPQTPLYAHFATAIKKAETESEQELLGRIREAGKRQWQANAWVLERRFPDRWSSPDSRHRASGEFAELLNLMDPLLTPGTKQELTDAVAQVLLGSHKPVKLLEAAADHVIELEDPSVRELLQSTETLLTKCQYLPGNGIQGALKDALSTVREALVNAKEK